MWYLLYTTILLTSVVFLPIPDAFGLPKQAVFIILGFSLIGIGLMNTNTKALTLKNKWLALIFIYVVLHSFGYYFFTPLIKTKEQVIGFSMNAQLATLTIILSLLIIQCLVEWTDDLKKWVVTGKFLCWLGFAFSIYAIIQWLGLDQIFHGDLRWVDNASPTNDGAEMHFVRYRMVTFLGNKRETACFIAMLSPMALMFKGLKYKIIYGVMCLTIVLTASGSSCFALIIGFLLYLLLTRRWKVFLGGVLSMPLIGWGVLKAYPNFFNFYGKGGLWKNVFMGSIPRFFVGHGIGTFPLLKYKVVSGAYEMVAINADFELLQLLSDGGLILLVLAMGYVVTLYRRVILEFLSSSSMLLIGYTVGLTTFLILTIGASPLHFSALLLIGVCYVASLEAQLEGGHYA